MVFHKIPMKKKGCVLGCIDKSIPIPIIGRFVSFYGVVFHASLLNFRKLSNYFITIALIVIEILSQLLKKRVLLNL
jgi:hypothetical protein